MMRPVEIDKRLDIVAEQIGDLLHHLRLLKLILATGGGASRSAIREANKQLDGVEATLVPTSDGITGLYSSLYDPEARNRRIKGFALTFH